MDKNKEMIAFLKKYSLVENAFIDDFFMHIDSSGARFVIDLSQVAKWLKMNKSNLMKPLKASYVLGTDYIINKPSQLPKGRGRGNIRNVMLTTDCFKTLCMRSNSQQADRVRAYFLAVEKTLFTYRDEIVSGMQQRINELENNQKPLDDSFKNTGVIYVIRSGNTRYKLGRSIDFAKRLRAHNSSEADNLEIVFIYKTNDAVTTEKCAKATLSSKQYRKYKEIYETDIDTIKMVIQGCGDLVQKIPIKRGRRNKQKGNGEMKTYMVFIKDEQS